MTTDSFETFLQDFKEQQQEEFVFRTNLRSFLVGAVKGIVDQNNEHPDKAYLRSALSSSVSFEEFVAAKQDELVDFLSRDYFVVWCIIAAHRGKGVDNVPMKEIAANFDYLKKQLFQTCDKKDLAAELLLCYVDNERLWESPFQVKCLV